MASIFNIGHLYSRTQVANVINMPEARRGGSWNTGYDRWQSEYFIFTNVGTPGRTGHDYANRWVGKSLIWYGKSGTTIHQPVIKELTSGIQPVHLFWRGADRSPFAYAGLAHPIAMRDSTPVEVTWDFAAQPSEPSNGAPSQGRLIRGPIPSVGVFSLTRENGPVSVYLFCLHGADKRTFPAKPDDAAVIKIGISNDPDRRLGELNWGFPPGCPLEWRAEKVKTFDDGLEAFAVEGQLLEAARLEGRWLGGEFVTATRTDIENALK